MRCVETLEPIRRGLPFLGRCFTYSLIILAIDLLAFFTVSFMTPIEVKSFLSLLLLVESGIGFTLGGVLDLVSSATVSKVLEETSRSKEKEPWTIKKYKSRQRTTNKIIATSALVFLTGLAISLA